MVGLALPVAGILAIFAAIGHGYLGDQTLRQQPIEPVRLKCFIRACYQFGSLGWLVGGILLLMSPTMLPESAMRLIAVVVPMYGFGAVVNFWFTKGRHFGWVLLLAIVLLACSSLIV